MKNKKVLIPAVAMAVLAAGGLVGGTLAYFTSESQHEITISTAKVSVTSEIVVDSLKTYSLGVEQPAGTFENEGSTATIDEDGKLSLSKVAPGDEARFDIKIKNASTIGIRYEVTTTLSGEGENPFVVTGASEGKMALGETEKLINVGVLLPKEVAGEAYMDKDYVLLVKVVALQSNAPKAVADQAGLEAAIEAGLPVELTNDVQLSSIVEVSELLEDGGEVTIVGNGNTITAAPGTSRAINIDGVEDVTLNLVDVKVVSAGERGISAYDAEGVEINVVNSEVQASMYSINVASNCPGAVVNVKDSSMASGWCGVQTWSANTTINIEGSTVSGLNDKTYNADGWNNFSTIVVNEPATNSVINIKDSKVVAIATTGNKQDFMSFRSENTTVNLAGEVVFELENSDAEIVAGIEDFTDALTFTSWDAIDTLSTNVLTIDKDNNYEVTYQHEPVVEASANKLVYTFNV